VITIFEMASARISETIKALIACHPETSHEIQKIAKFNNKRSKLTLCCASHILWGTPALVP
jgi:hypothetical protein